MSRICNHHLQISAKRGRSRAWLGLIVVLPVILAACSSGSAGTAATDAPAKIDGAVKIGYLSMGESDPFVAVVSQSIRDEAAKEGVELVECDAQFLADKALECASIFKAKGVASVINWQLDEPAAAAVCEAYGNLPTVAVDVPQVPCEKVFVGADNRKAGVMAGEGLADFAKKKFDCKYDAYVSLDFPSLPGINKARAGGSKEGFEGVCGAVPADKYFTIDTLQGSPDQQENTRRQMTDVLTSIPDARVILLVGPSGEPMVEAAFNAAKTAGRYEDLWVVGHGADVVALPYIRNDPHWPGSVAYYPERYGELAVPAAVKLARGESVPREVLVTHEFITADNVDSVYPE